MTVVLQFVCVDGAKGMVAARVLMSSSGKSVMALNDTVQQTHVERSKHVTPVQDRNSGIQSSKACYSRAVHSKVPLVILKNVTFHLT
jgi:hypothetical protein